MAEDQDPGLSHGSSINPDNSGSSVPLRSSLTFRFGALSASISAAQQLAERKSNERTQQKRQQRTAFGFHAFDVSRGLARAGGHYLEAAGYPLPVRPQPYVAEDQEPGLRAVV